MKTKKKISEIHDTKEGLTQNNELMQQLVDTDKSADETTSPQETAEPVANEGPSQPVVKTEPKLKVSRKRNGQDTSIAKNISNGEQVVELLLSWGDEYDQSREELMPAALAAKNVLGNTFIDTVTENKQFKTDDINDRQDVYGPIEELARRARNEAIASGVSEKVIKDMSHFIDLLTGKRIIKRKANDTRKKISAIHTTHSQKVQSFNGLIQVLKSEPLYNPIKDDIKITGLEETLANMKTSNKSAYASQASYSTSIKKRNMFFNEPITGYVATYQAVKNAAKAIFGSSSDQYKQISRFKFTRIK